MEIKRREVLFSVVIILLMLFFGILLCDKVQEGNVEIAERYSTATVIENSEQFKYGMKTNYGNALVYGEVSADNLVTYDEIGEGYIYIKKVKEHYTRHTRVVTRTVNGKPRTTTEVYWTWDRVHEDSKHTDSIVFMDESFPYGTISLPSYRLDLDDIGVKNRNNYIYQDSDDRFYYNVTPSKLVGTVFANLHSDTVNDVSALYLNQTPAEVVESKHSIQTTSGVIFWIFWTVLTCGIVYAFIALDNRWLD